MINHPLAQTDSKHCLGIVIGFFALAIIAILKDDKLVRKNPSYSGKEITKAREYMLNAPKKLIKEQKKKVFEIRQRMFESGEGVPASLQVLRPALYWTLRIYQGRERNTNLGKIIKKEMDTIYKEFSPPLSIIFEWLFGWRI